MQVAELIPSIRSQAREVWRAINLHRSNRCKKTPSILQMEITECAAACLAIVLAYYKKWVPLEELRRVCGVSRDGVDAPTIIQAAIQYGMTANAYSVEINQLDQVKLPCIIFWKFRHYCVLEGLYKRRVWINDPVAGRKVIPIEEFGLDFTGLVIETTPGADFAPAGRPPRFLPLILRELQTVKDAVFYLLLLGSALIMPGVLIPVFSRVFVDDILLAGQENWLRPLLAGLALTAVFRLVTAGIQQKIRIKLERWVAVQIITKTVRTLLHLPMLFFSQREPGDLLQRVTVGNRVSDLISSGFITNIIGLIEVVFFGAVMAILSLPLALVCFGVSATNLLALQLLKTRYEDASRLLAREQGKLAATTTRHTMGLEALRASGSEDHSFAECTGQQAKYLTAKQKAGVINAIQGAIPGFVGALSNVAILGYGAQLVISGNLTVGTLVAFQSLYMSFSGPINGLMRLAANYQSIKGNLSRVRDIFDYDAIKNSAEEKTKPQRNLAIGQLTGQVELKNVVFGYAPLKPPLIKNLSLKLQPGDRIAFVGPSGSGKSTIARLICGLYPPQGGQILYDGMPQHSLPNELFAASAGFVDQEISLFEGSLRDNLTLWGGSTPDESIWSALRDAELADLIANRENQLDCYVEENGANFSGGERARIEIARVLLKSPSIIILDEATAALDTITEQRVMQAIARRNCSAIILAHRLSAVRNCDEIIVLDRGNVVERGDHDTLMRRTGTYHALFQQE